MSDADRAVTVRHYAMQPNAQQIAALTLTLSADGWVFELADANGAYRV